MAQMVRARRSQAERSASTRAALLDATEACLVEDGFARTTTTEVAHRAGVSLGALLHHFPTKADLLVAAVRRVYEVRLEEYRKAVAQLPDGADRIDAALDLLWSMFAGPTFVACLELEVAARTDGDLRAEVARLNDWFTGQTRELFGEVFSGVVPADEEGLRIAHTFTFAVMQGLAFGHLCPGDVKDDPADALAVLKMLGHQFFDSLS